VIWERKVRSLPGGEDLQSWGPTELEWKKCIEYEFGPSWEENGEDSEVNHGSEDEQWEDDDDEIEGELLESMETIVLSEEYRADDQEEFLYYGHEFAGSAERQRRVSLSPRKRGREEGV
jgi:hypothetical protein